MALDFDGWLGAQDEDTRGRITQFIDATPEALRSAAKDRLASQFIVAESTGLELDAIDKDWDMIRGGFAAQKGGDWPAGVNDEAAFHAKVKSEMQFRRDERHLLFGPDDEKAADAADRRKLSLSQQLNDAAFTGVTFADAFASWQGSAIVSKGWRKDRHPQHETVGRAIYDRAAATVAKVKPIADEAFAKLAADRGVGDGPADFLPFELFRGLSADEKGAAFRLISQRANGAGVDKSRTQAFGEGLARGAENLAMGAALNPLAMSFLYSKQFKEGDTVYGDSPLDYWNRGESQRAREGTMFVKARTMTAEEAKDWNKQLADMGEDVKTMQALRSIAMREIDPTDKAGGYVFQKFVMPVADSFALMAGMATSGPATMFAAAGQYQNEQFQRLTDAGMDNAEALRIAMDSGLAQAALDKFQVELIASRIPAVRNVLNRFALGGSVASRFVANTAATAVAETGIELVQDHVIPALAQDMLATNPAFDVDWSDVWRDAAKAAPETAMGMVLLSALGGGIQTAQQNRYVRDLSNSKSAMTLAGYTDAQIELIQQQPLSERGAMLAQFAPSQAPTGVEKDALIERFAKAASEEKQTAEAQLSAETGATSDALDYAIRVTRDGDEWTVTTADNKKLVVDSAEAARRIRDELRQASSEKEAQYLVALVEDWHAKAGENNTRETTFTGEDVRSDGRTVEVFRDGEKVREITDAKTLDTIRREAEVVAGQTGDSDVNVAVNGANILEFQNKVGEATREVVQRLEINRSPSSVLTFLHESMESNWRAGVASGTFSAEASRRAVASIASAFDPASTNDPETRAFFERVQSVANGTADDTTLRETISELAVADVVGRRKDGGSMKVGSITAALDAAIRNTTDAAEVRAIGKLRAFIRAAKQFFRAVFATAAAIKKAKKTDGALAADWESFMNKLLGIDEQVAHDSAVADEMASTLEFDENGDPDWTMNVSRVTPAQDAEYMKAVESGDMETAQRMVDEAAKAAGYDAEAYHGSGDRFTVFDASKRGATATYGQGLLFASKRSDTAKTYMEQGSTAFREALQSASTAEQELRDIAYRAGLQSHHGIGKLGDNMINAQREGRVPQAALDEYFRVEEQYYAAVDAMNSAPVGEPTLYHLRLKTGQAFKSDAGGMSWQYVMPKAVDAANNGSYDSIIVDNVVDRADEIAAVDTIYVLRQPSQIKSAEPVTRDESGNVIPLSQRFNGASNDIRFSLSAGQRLEAIQRAADNALARDPDARRRIQRQASNRLQKMQHDYEFGQQFANSVRSDVKPLVEQRSAKSLDKEQAFREAARREELEAEVYGVYGEVLDNEGMAQIWGAGPVMEMLSSPGSKLHGKLMTKAAALRSNKFNNEKAGDFDGIDGIPRVVFGGSMMPDEMAKELFEMGLLKDDSAQSLWDAIRSELKNAERWKSFLKTAKEDLKRARNQAKEEMSEWRREQDEMQKRDWNPHDRMLRDLRALDAITGVLPPEIRGKVGGMVKVASLKTDEARFKEIVRRVKKLGGLVETHLQKESIDAVEALIEKAEPSTGPGEKPKGKITVEGHRVFAAVESVWKMTNEQADAKRAELDAKIEKKLAAGEGVIDLLEGQQILEMFGAFAEKTAAEMDAAATWLANVYRTGRNAWRMIEESRLAEIEGLKAQTIAAVGKATLSGTMEQKATAARLKAIAESTSVNLLSFVQVLENLLGANHPLAKRWESAARRATAQKTDGILAANARLLDAAKSAFNDGSRREVARRLWDMGNERKIEIPKVEGGGTETISVPRAKVEGFENGTLNPADFGYSQAEAQDLIDASKNPDNARKKNLTFERVTVGEAVPAKLTELEAISLTMLAMQAQYAPNLEKHGFTQDVIDAAEDGITEGGKMLRSFLLKEYADGYAPLARIFRDMHGIDLTQIANYSPAAFTHAGASREVDPFGGGLLAEGGFRSGFLKSRKEHLSEPKIDNALSVFTGHVAQTEHWKAFAPLVRELRGVFDSVDVKRSVESNRGTGILYALQGWVTALEANGLQQRAFASALNPLFRYITGRQATLTLAWKLGTLLKQTTAMISSAARIGVGPWMRGFARVASGKVDVRKIYESQMIQRRIESGFSPEVRGAMTQLFSGKPSAWSDFVLAGMENIGKVDAFFTSIGTAIAYDYHLQQGASEEQALAEAESVLGRTAQPTENIDRSLYELGMSPAERIGFMFASNQRKDTALLISAYQQWKAGNISGSQLAQVYGVAWLATGLMSALIGAAWRDANNDDDDEWLDWENWNPADIVKTTVLGPLGGIPLIASFINTMNGYGPNDPFKPAKSAKNAVAKITDGDKAEPIEATWRRVVDVANGAALFIPKAEAFAVGANLLEQVANLADNALPDTESEAEKKEKAATARDRKAAR